MNRDIRIVKRYFTTSVTDIDMIQEFLEEMALDGWM